MSEDFDKLDQLIAELKSEGAVLERMDASDLEIIKRVCNDKRYVVILFDFLHLSGYFINSTGEDYYGMKSDSQFGTGLDWFLEKLHPEDSHVIRGYVSHFEEHPSIKYNSSFRTRKNGDGDWRWFYLTQKALNFDGYGKPEYIISIGFDIIDLINNQKQRLAGMNGEYLEKLQRYESLTSRERQVLQLVVEEMTSQEIAKTLYIETSTVDTHRKNIMRKLKVRNALGLVEYSLLHSNGQPSAKIKL